MAPFSLPQSPYILIRYFIIHIHLSFFSLWRHLISFLFPTAIVVVVVHHGITLIFAAVDVRIFFGVITTITAIECSRDGWQWRVDPLEVEFALDSRKLLAVQGEVELLGRLAILEGDVSNGW